jgi:serine/threonine protein kinase
MICAFFGPSLTYYSVHQDIKPDNILLSQSPLNSKFSFIFKLADMGLAYIPPADQHNQVARGRERPSTQMFGKFTTFTNGLAADK